MEVWGDPQEGAGEGGLRALQTRVVRGHGRVPVDMSRLSDSSSGGARLASDDQEIRIRAAKA